MNIAIPVSPTAIFGILALILIASVAAGMVIHAIFNVIPQQERDEATQDALIRLDAMFRQ